MEASLQADTARAKLENAKAAVETAAAALQADEYVEARAEVDRLTTMLEMYTRKLEMIRNREIGTEAETNQVIDALLAYESELTKDFQKELRKALDPVEELNTKYRQEIVGIEYLITVWTQQIHANYESRGRSTYVDADGKRTSRSPVPIPVHAAPFNGCRESNKLTEYLPILLHNE